MRFIAIEYITIYKKSEHSHGKSQQDLLSLLNKKTRNEKQKITKLESESDPWLQKQRLKHLLYMSIIRKLRNVPL